MILACILFHCASQLDHDMLQNILVKSRASAVLRAVSIKGSSFV